MLKWIVGGLFGAVLFGSGAMAQTCSAFTYNLTNGTTADASQVMSNFNTVRSCANNLASGGTLANTTLSGTTTLSYSSALFSRLFQDSTNTLNLQQAETTLVAPAVTLISTPTGVATIGPHVFAVTCIVPGGETAASTASSSIAIDASHQQATVTVPLCSGFATGRNIYASKIAGSTPLYLIATSPVVNDNTTTTYTFNTGDGSFITGTTAPTATSAINTFATVKNSGTNWFGSNTFNFTGAENSDAIFQPRSRAESGALGIATYTAPGTTGYSLLGFFSIDDPNDQVNVGIGANGCANTTTYSFAICDYYAGQDIDIETSDSLDNLNLFVFGNDGVFSAPRQRLVPGDNQTGLEIDITNGTSTGPSNGTIWLNVLGTSAAGGIFMDSYTSTAVGGNGTALVFNDLDHSGNGFDIGFSSYIFGAGAHPYDPMIASYKADANFYIATSIYGTTALFEFGADGALTLPGNLNLSVASASSTVCTDGSKNLSTSCGTAGGSGAVQTISFQPGSLTSVTSTKAGFTKFVKASVVDNVELSALLFTCSGNPTVTLYECGTSTSCSSPTTIGSATVTAAGAVVDGSISSANIAAGHYIAWAISAGTCTSLNLAATAQVHAN